MVANQNEGKCVQKQPLDTDTIREQEVVKQLCSKRLEKTPNTYYYVLSLETVQFKEI